VGSTRLLVVDEDQRTFRALALGGFDVVVASDASDAVRLAAELQPEAVVVDAGRSDDVLGACRTLRSAGLTAPLLALGTRDAVATRVAVLEAGADDYVVKPFVVDELLARVRALVRRGAAATGELVQVARLGL
jgi:DNA-binding response OmpR family regulator